MPPFGVLVVSADAAWCRRTTDAVRELNAGDLEAHWVDDVEAARQRRSHDKPELVLVDARQRAGKTGAFLRAIAVPVEGRVPLIALGGRVFDPEILEIVVDAARMQVSARRDLAQRLATSQQLEVIGHLAAGIAHELNTPAQFIGDNLRFLADAQDQLCEVLARQRALLQAAARHADIAAGVRELDAHCERTDFFFVLEEAREAVDAAIEGVDRMADIVHSVKAYAHRDADGDETLDLNKSIRSAVAMTRSEWKNIADLELHLDPDLPTIECRASEISQAILNLLLNAAHAVGDAQRESGSRGRIALSTRTRGDEVVVCVADNGTGIPPEVRPRILEPFFTTKPVGRGTGLGLALARASIVERHGGRLTFESEQSNGTTFEICLPLRPSVRAA